MNVYLAEFVGVTLLVLLGNGVVANVCLNKTKGQNGGLIAITVGWGLAVAFAICSVGRISGAHINPAVTIGLASIGEFSWSLVPGYLIAQMAGGVIGGALVWLTYLPHWAVTEDPGAKLGCFANTPAIHNPISNLFTEVVGTAVLVFCVLAIGAVARDSLSESVQEGLVTAFSNWVSPLLTGLLVLAIGLSLGGPTGYAINPARDLGPRIAHALLPIAGKGSNHWGYAWIPVVGPILGGVIGAVLFRLLGLGA